MYRKDLENRSHHNLFYRVRTMMIVKRDSCNGRNNYYDDSLLHV